MALKESVHTTMHDVEEEYEEKDDSRPFFQRQTCEVGIYMTVFDATPIDEKSIGLDHYFRMKTTEICHDEFNKLDTVNIRAAFDERNILTDMYIERFEPANDMKMVRRLKAYQQVIAMEILTMRDVDNEMEVNRSDFMNCIRNLLADDNDGIATLIEYEQLNNSHKACNMYHKDLLDKFSAIIQKWRMYYKTFGHELLIPLRQMHKVCENEKQVAIKAKIINGVLEMQIMLQADFELKRVRHPDMEKKIIRREWPVFLGLLSVVPMGTERMSDIDILIDEYMREFNLDLKV